MWKVLFLRGGGSGGMHRLYRHSVAVGIPSIVQLWGDHWKPSPPVVDRGGLSPLRSL